MDQPDADPALTPEIQAALALLWDAGFAAIAFTPTELRGADPERVQDICTERGWDAIDTLATEPEPETDDETDDEIADDIRDDVPALMELARVWRDVEAMARERGDEVDAEVAATRKRKYVARLTELGALA